MGFFLLTLHHLPKFNNPDPKVGELFPTRLTGSIPPEIGNLTSLTRLYLNKNRLSGIIPEEITSLTRLDRLYLADNCNLYTENTDVQNFIDNIESSDTYQHILETNTHTCTVMTSIITYLLN